MATDTSAEIIAAVAAEIASASSRSNVMTTNTRTVTIPSRFMHEGYPGCAIKVVLEWVCPICGEPRGEPFPTISWDGSRRLGVDGWMNPCGHIDKYVDVRDEMCANGLNPQYATPEMQS